MSSTVNRATPPAANNRQLAAAVTPDMGLSSRMKVEKKVFDELLLVCGVIGTTTQGQDLVPVTDCLNWLQDLQRALRRDEDLYRPISLMIGNLKVVQQKLLPLVTTCRYDTPMVLTIVKILVILTKPLHENTKRAAKLVIDTKSGKTPPSVLVEQKKLRENALAQVDLLMEFKRAIVHHPSHIRSKKNEEGGILSIFVSLLAEPLSKAGASRTDADHLTIELVLHLFRNLLSANTFATSHEAAQRSTQLHNELISLFERELVLEIVTIICQDMELRENTQYNLLLMELLHHLLRSQDPSAVARSHQKENPAGKENTTRPQKSISKKRAAPQGGGSLRAQLQRDKQRLGNMKPTRHGNFGGTLMVKKKDGKHQYVGATSLEGLTKKSEPKRRRNKKSEPFIGSGRATLASQNQTAIVDTDGGPSAMRARRSLHNFCSSFMEKCYAPFMKSLKNEFRRDSARLEEADQVVFFRMIWFFLQWWRFGGSKQKSSDTTESNSVASHLVITMDVFSFNMVLTATDYFSQHKKYTRLAQAVALYSEMMQLLNRMYHSQEETEHLMALGLLDRLFYGNEPTDRLPKLFSTWVPGTTTREYICDLVELCHVSLKLLEANARVCADVQPRKKRDKTPRDMVTRMREAASDFDVTSYMVRKLVSNQVVFMYTKLLDQYLLNAHHVNHHIAAFFLRLAKLKISNDSTTDEDVDPDMPKNLLASKRATLEPMLYNIHLMLVLNKILSDTSIRNDSSYSSLLAFASGIMHNFAIAAESNPLLYVECLFKHPLPHRFCDLLHNHYVDEELRMIAEKELLLEEQRRYEAENESDDEVPDEEDELELTTTQGDLEAQSDTEEPQTTRTNDEETNNDSAVDHPTVDKENREANADSEDELELGGTMEDFKKKLSKKRKLHRKVLSDDSSDEELDLGNSESLAASPKASSKKKPRKAIFDGDSSDEDLS